MEQIQLELDFDHEDEALSSTAEVIELRAFADARARRLRAAEETKLLAEIVKSVEYITGRSPEAEMM